MRTKVTEVPEAEADEFAREMEEELAKRKKMVKSAGGKSTEGFYVDKDNKIQSLGEND